MSLACCVKPLNPVIIARPGSVVSTVAPVVLFTTTYVGGGPNSDPFPNLKTLPSLPYKLSYHDSPRYVMMSLEEYVRLKGATIVATPESFPESVLARIREIADSHPEIEHEIGGGLAALLDQPETSGDVRPR